MSSNDDGIPRNMNEDDGEPAGHGEDELDALLRDPSKKAALLRKMGLEDHPAGTSDESSHSTPSGKSMSGWGHYSHHTPSGKSTGG